MEIILAFGGNRAKIDTLGAQLKSLTLSGREMLWQGDPDIWGDHALVLFPFIGRCRGDGYTHRGKSYPMGLHGFAWKKEFSPVAVEGDRCLLELTEDAATRECYPFAFRFQVGFRLEDGGLEVTFRVENRCRETMPFALGWHPGFRLENSPEQYRLRFPNATEPKEICIHPKCMVTGQEAAVPMDEDIFPLSGDLFQTSARVYRGMGAQVVLETKAGQPLLTLEAAGFPITTLWQTLGSNAKFLCLESWLGRPGHENHVEELADSGKVLLEPGQVLERKIRVSSCGTPREKCR